ncbi:MAG TPA: omptin family outer membrane protease [bacterium]
MSHRSSGSAAVLASALALACAAVPVRAATLATAEASWQAPAGVTLSLGAGIGVLEGTAFERSYAPWLREFKLSELKWDLSDVAMAGIEGTATIGRWVRVGGTFWAAVSDGDGGMVDRDWLLRDSTADNQWTHESRHPDTTVDKGWTGDVDVDVRAFSAGALTVRGVLGYRQDVWEWSARGGTFIYTVDANGDGLIGPDEFRSRRGSFPAGRLVISYRQEYRVPYLGVVCDGAFGPVQVQGRLLYGPWVSAEDHDFHALRATTFDGEFTGGEWLGTGVAGTWHFAPRWYAVAGVEYEKYGELTGDVLVRSPEGAALYEDGGGMELETVLVRLGAGFRF